MVDITHLQTGHFIDRKKMNKQEIIKLIDKNYIKSGNKICMNCEVNLKCSKCPMLKAMLDLKDKLNKNE